MNRSYKGDAIPYSVAFLVTNDEFRTVWPFRNGGPARLGSFKAGPARLASLRRDRHAIRPLRREPARRVLFNSAEV